MKKNLSLQIVILVVISLSLISCTNNKSGQPEKVLSSFKKMYPTTKAVKWENIKDSIFTAQFKIDDTETFVTFNNSGGWLKKSTTVTADQIPAVVMVKIEDFYKGCTITRSAFIEKPDFKAYEIDIEIMNKKIELLISESGDLQKAKAAGIVE